MKTYEILLIFGVGILIGSLLDHVAEVMESRVYFSRILGYGLILGGILIAIFR